MNKIQVMESLSKILDKIYNAMDEIDDVVDNDIPKAKAESYLISASMEIDNLIEVLDNEAVIDGTRSGAI